MKRWKPGVLLQGVPLVVHTLIPALEAVDQLILVGGYQFEELEKLVTASHMISAAQKSKITLVENNDYSAGMFSSVCLGLSLVHPSQDGVYIVPGDMPSISVETYRTLAAVLAAEAGPDVFVPTLQIESDINTGAQRPKKGHPVLVRRRVISGILAKSRTAILRDVLKQFQSKTILVSDPGICFDVDEESDAARLDLDFHLTRHQKNGPAS